MKRLFIIAALAALSSAHAGNDVPGNCGQGSGSGNGCTSTTGNNKNSNANANTNSNSNTNKARGGTATANAQGGLGGVGVGGSGGMGGLGGTGGNSVTGPISNTNSAAGGSSDNTVTVSSSHRAAASSAFAPTVYPTANCAVAGGFAVQGVGFGLSGGAATIDPSCEVIEQAKAAQAIGQAAVAQEVLCSLPKVRAARKHTGNPCWADTAEGIADAKAQEPSDPFVRRRLGLAPLEQ